MAGPWEKYGQQPAGDPIIAPADPYKQAAEQRASQAQQIQSERLDLSRAANERADRAEARAAAVEERQAATAKRGTVEQGKAAAFLRRAINAEGNFRSLGEVQPRSLPGQMFKDQFPNAANYISDSERQRADQAEREFIAAVLRYDSGAAIPDSEFVTNGQIYFPRPGDTPETLAQKAQARRTAIEGLFAASGPAASDLQLPDFGAARPSDGTRSPEMVGDVPKGTRVELGMDRWGEDDPFNRADYLQETYGISPNQEASITAFWNQNRGNQGLTLEGAKAWYAENGIPAPSDADLAAGVERAKAGEAGFGQFDTSQAEADYLAALDRIIAERGIDPEAMSETAGQSAASGVTLGFIDELGGAGGAVRGLVQGNSPIGGYQVERDVMRRIRERGAAANPGTALTGELVGGLATGALGVGGRGRSAMQVARDLRGTGQAVSRGAIQSGMVRDATVQGAKIGGVAGFGYGEGAEGSATNALLGAASGAVVGNLLQRGGNALANRGPAAPPPSTGPDAAQRRLIEAGQRQNVPMRQPDVRPELRGKFRNLEQSETGGPVARAAIESDRAATEAAVRNISDGTARGPFSFGNMAQQAITRTSERMRGQAGRHFERARREIGDEVVPADNVINSIDQRIAGLKSSGEGANASEISVLEGIKSDLQKTGLTVDVVQAQRKGLRDRISRSGAEPNRTEAGFMDLMAQMGDELERGIRQTAPNAADALRAGNSAWAERAQFKQFIGKTFLGTRNAPVAPETAAARFTSMAKDKGDYNRFSKALEQLEPEEKADFAATIAQGMGTKANGEFEYGKFLRDLNGMNPRALRDLFGKDGIAALRDLRDIARAKSGTLAEKNSSKTGGVVVAATNRFQQMIMTAFGGAAGGLPGAAAGAMATGAAEQFASKRAARLLLNPDFTKWLKQTPNTTNPKAINRHFERLDRIAARNTIIAADARALQEHLMQSFAQSPATRAAASDEEQPIRREPPQ